MLPNAEPLQPPYDSSMAKSAHDFRPVCGYCGHRGRVHATEHGPNDEEPTWCPECVECWRSGSPSDWQLHGPSVIKSLDDLAVRVRAAAAEEGVELTTELQVGHDGRRTLMLRSFYVDTAVAIVCTADWSSARRLLVPACGYGRSSDTQYADGCGRSVNVSPPEGPVVEARRPESAAAPQQEVVYYHYACLQETPAMST